MLSSRSGAKITNAHMRVACSADRCQMRPKAATSSADNFTYLRQVLQIEVGKNRVTTLWLLEWTTLDFMVEICIFASLRVARNVCAVESSLKSIRLGETSLHLAAAARKCPRVDSAAN